MKPIFICFIQFTGKQGIKFMDDKLNQYRNDLTRCDEILADALRRRFEIVSEMTDYKKENSLPVLEPEEETHKKQSLDEKLADSACKEAVLAVFDSILEQSKQIQAQGLLEGNLFLVGFMGAGKSTISRALEEVFAMKVIEMDEIIARQNGMSIPEIFEEHGEEYFRNEETALIKGLQNEKNCIVSCGGGVAMREVNVNEMKKSGKVILLTANPETILERVADSHDRPLLENNKTVEYISELMEKRRPFYEAAADITIHTDGKSANEIVEEIIKDLRN